MENNDVFYEYAHDILAHELFLQSKNILAHGAVSIYDHSIEVAGLAFRIAEKYKKKHPELDMRCVIRSALLHDFFLYEWHIPGWRYIIHGWTHPVIAAKKAREIFNITDKEYSCIKTHMWPWVFWRLPRCREGWIISWADKISALKEATLLRKKHLPRGING